MMEDSPIFPIYNNSLFNPDLDIAIKSAHNSHNEEHLEFYSPAMMTSNFSLNHGGFNNSTVFIPEGPPVDSLSEEKQYQLQMLNYWINGVITNLVVILGLIGNILTIVILSQRAMRSSTNYYLSALAVWDSIVLVSTAFLIGLPGTNTMSSYMSYVFAYVVSYFYPLALIAQTATIWLTVSFTVERYIAVCHPLKAASMCTISRAKIVILGVSLGSSLYNIPRWFDFEPVTSENPSSNQTVVIPQRTEFSQNHIYLEVYFSWLYVPIMCIVPLLVLSILNMFLILAVRKSQRQRKDMNVKQSRENNVTIMLVSVVIVFIICQVPALVYNIAFAVDNKYVDNSFGYQVLSTIRNFLVNFNSAINFLLYCALGQKFRRIFLHTFFRRCIHETYIPMSGVHPPTTMVQHNHHSVNLNKGYYKSRPLGNRMSNSTTSAKSTTTTTNTTLGTSRSSQESALMGTGNCSTDTSSYSTNYTPTAAPMSALKSSSASSSRGGTPAPASVTPAPDILSNTQVVLYTPGKDMVTSGYPKDKRNKFHRSSDFVDSDCDDMNQHGYDMGLEHLLPEHDPCSDPPNSHGYANGSDISIKALSTSSRGLSPL